MSIIRDIKERVLLWHSILYFKCAPLRQRLAKNADKRYFQKEARRWKKEGWVKLFETVGSPALAEYALTNSETVRLTPPITELSWFDDERLRRLAEHFAEGFVCRVSVHGRAIDDETRVWMLMRFS